MIVVLTLPMKHQVTSYSLKHPMQHRLPPQPPGREPWMPGLSPPLFFTLAPSHCSPKCHSRSRWLVAYLAPASGKIIAENLKNHASSVSPALPGVLGSFLPTELIWTTLLSLECLTLKGRAVAGSSGPSLPKDCVFFRKIPTSCSQHYRFQREEQSLLRQWKHVKDDSVIRLPLTYPIQSYLCHFHVAKGGSQMTFPIIKKICVCPRS